MTNNGIEKNATKSKLTIKSVKINVYYSNSKRFSYPDAIHKTMLETRFIPFIDGKTLKTNSILLIFFEYFLRSRDVLNT